MFRTQRFFRVGPIFNVNTELFHLNENEKFIKFIIETYPEFNFLKDLNSSILQPSYHFGDDGFSFIFVETAFFANFGKDKERTALNNCNTTGIDCTMFIPSNSMDIKGFDKGYPVCSLSKLNKDLENIKQFLNIKSDDILEEDVLGIQNLIQIIIRNAKVLFENKSRILINNYLYKIYRNACNLAIKSEMPLTLVSAESNNMATFIKLEYILNKIEGR